MTWGLNFYGVFFAVGGNKKHLVISNPVSKDIFRFQIALYRSCYHFGAAVDGAFFLSGGLEYQTF